MKCDFQKVIYATVKTNTSYGRHVLACIDKLKDRFCLPTTQLIQEALIAYEYTTRDKYPAISITGEYELKEESLVTKEEQQEKEERIDVLGILPLQDDSPYQM